MSAKPLGGEDVEKQDVLRWYRDWIAKLFASNVIVYPPERENLVAIGDELEELRALRDEMADLLTDYFPSLVAKAHRAVVIAERANALRSGKP